MRRKFMMLAASAIHAGRVTHRARTMLLFAMLSAMVSGNNAMAQSNTKPNAEARQACAADVKTLCADVQRGGGRIRKCMIEKREQLSDGCKSAMQAARAMSSQ